MSTELFNRAPGWISLWSGLVWSGETAARRSSEACDYWYHSPLETSIAMASGCNDRRASAHGVTASVSPPRRLRSYAKKASPWCRCPYYSIFLGVCGAGIYSDARGPQVKYTKQAPPSNLPPQSSPKKNQEQPAS